MNEYTQEQIDGFHKTILDMSQYQLCYKWRMAETGCPLFRNDLFPTGSDKPLGEIYRQRMQEKGGFTPAISKSIGWEG